MTRGILGTTVRFGSRRVDGDAGSRRVADADEDVVTLAVAALRAHLAQNGLGADAIGELCLVGRFEDAGIDTILSALDRPDVPVSRHADAADAAVDAVLAAHEGDAKEASFVVAASDGRGDGCPDDWGAAAAVVTIGAGSHIRLEAQAHHHDAAQTAAAHAHRVLEPIGALGDAGIHLAPTLQRARDAKTVVPAPSRAHPLMPVDQLGALGTAAPLVALAHGLETRGDHALAWWHADAHGAVGARLSAGGTPHGTGVVDAAAGPAVPITAAAARAARDAWATGGMTAQGAFVSMQAYLGQAAARHRWVGQRCGACSEIVFPPRESCPTCAATELEPHPLSGLGTVYARTRIGTGGAPTEFSPLQDATGPYDVAVVALAEGPRVAAMCTAAPRMPAIGDPVRLELRLLYVQDGAPRYGFKAVATASA